MRFPMRCPTGACVASVTDCPQDTRCSTKWPVKCSDGSCKESVDKCPVVSISTGTACKPTEVRCPMGSCAPAMGLCPKSSSCKYGEVKCWDGSCRQFNATQKVDPCPDNLLESASCPKVDFPDTTGNIRCPDGTCAFNMNDCPTGPICPPEFAVLCPDKSCNESLAQCPDFSPCPDTKILCADGTCQRLEENCGRPVTCTAKKPYKCFDQTCRKAPQDCPAVPRCDSETPFLCSDGSCKKARDSCNSVGTCGFVDCNIKGYCIRCPGDLQNKGEGAIRNGCAKVVGACDEYADDDETGACLPDFNRCPVDGSCRKIEDRAACPVDTGCKSYLGCNNVVDLVKTCKECPQAECPAHAPERCPSGLCMKSLASCASIDTGCPAARPLRCNGGTCVNSKTECAGPSENATVGAACSTFDASYAARKLCKDGSCQDPCPVTLTGNGCTAAAPIRCAGVAAACVADETKCLAEQFCREPSLYRCDNGLCVSSSLLCASSPIAPGTDTGCPAASPAPCADGSCSASLAQCPVLHSCKPGEEFRCNDGSCKATKNMCAIGSVPPGVPDATDGTKPTSFCPKTRSFRCANGMCVADFDTCINLDPKDTAVPLGCSKKFKVKCALTGACVASGGDCTTTVSGSSNGCPSDRSFKCTSGACKEKETDCLAASGCPGATPLRCADGTCESNTAACNKREAKCPAAKGVRCKNGACMEKYEECTGSNLCLLTTPVRCEDGSCVASPTSCPPTLVCPDAYPVLCADGACVGASNLCKPTFPCPDGTVKCSDLTCQKTCAGRTKLCPSGTPTQCPTGQCVLSPSDCTGWPDALSCPTVSPVRCVDGRCQKSVLGCVGTTAVVETLKNVTKTTTTTVGNVTTTTTTVVEEPVKTGTTTVTSLNPVVGGDDPVGEKCPAATPVKCTDGKQGTDAVIKCFPTVGECVCGAGKTLCADATCAVSAAACPVIGRCRSETPKRCTDGTCVAIDATCSAQNPVTTAACPASTTRCADGLCRKSCPTTNGCFGSTPVMCPDGSCKADSGAKSCVLTVSPPSWIKAPGADATCAIGQIICPDASCVNTAAACGTKLRASPVIPTKISTSCSTGWRELSMATTDDGKSAAKLIVPSGAFGTCDIVPVSVGPVAETEVNSIVVTVDETRVPVFGATLDFDQACLSTLVRVSAGVNSTMGGSADAPLNNKVQFIFRVDYVPQGHPNSRRRLLESSGKGAEDLCLAYVNAAGKWECIDRDLVFMEANVFMGLSDFITGIFGIVLIPVNIPVPQIGCPKREDEGQNQCAIIDKVAKEFVEDKEEWAKNDDLCCGTKAYPDCDKCPSIWDLYWYIFVIVIVMVVVIGLVTTYVLWRMSRYRKKWQAAKAIMMADMGGDNLVLFKDAVKGKGDMPYMPTNDDNMMMSNNPMFEIEADNLARKQALLQEELDKEKLNGAAVSLHPQRVSRVTQRGSKRGGGGSQCLHAAVCTHVRLKSLWVVCSLTSSDVSLLLASSFLN